MVWQQPKKISTTAEKNLEMGLTSTALGLSTGKILFLILADIAPPGGELVKWRAQRQPRLIDWLQ